MSTLSSAVMSEVDTNLHKWLNELEGKNDIGAKVVDFDPIWKWAGYNQKNDGKKALERLFRSGPDYSCAFLKNGRGRPREQILLTIDAAKEFLLQAPTEKGKQVRHYFIESEKKWRLLKTNVESGRIRMEDKVTGEVVDNPLNDAEYLDTRADVADFHITEFNTITKKFHDEVKQSHCRDIASLTSEMVLGKRPREFLVENKLIKKRANRNGHMVYPSHPNGRDVMTKAQLHAVAAMQALTDRLFQDATTFDAGMAEFKRRQGILKDVYHEMHGDHLQKPTALEDVKALVKTD